MFRGQFEHSIDAKGRLSIPAKFRDVLQSKSHGGSAGRGAEGASRGNPATDRLIVTNHDHCVYAYAIPDFEGIEQKLASQPQSEKVKAFSRMFIGGAHECELDPTGRILIPPPLRRYAGLEKDVVLVGVTKRFEIWSAERWKSESAKNEQVIAADHDFIPDV